MKLLNMNNKNRQVILLLSIAAYLVKNVHTYIHINKYLEKSK